MMVFWLFCFSCMLASLLARKRRGWWQTGRRSEAREMSRLSRSRLSTSPDYAAARRGVIPSTATHTLFAISFAIAESNHMGRVKT